MALPGTRRRPQQGRIPLAAASLHLLPVVDGGQFLELGQRAQGRSLGLTRATTARGQDQSGRCYSGKGNQLNELVHRKCVNAGAGRKSQGRLLSPQGKNQARGHKSVAPGFPLKCAYFPGTTTFGGATGTGAGWFDAQDASANPAKAARTATILVNFMSVSWMFQVSPRYGENLPDDQGALNIICQGPHNSEARQELGLSLSRKKRPALQGRPL